MKRRLWAPSPTFVIPPIALFVPPVRRVLVLAALLAAIVLGVRSEQRNIEYDGKHLRQHH
jgi:hypothetical protein